mmetsp:Transcript_30042/g.44528  ORF Transcript_30042/g.44528 Transcript_30042/m.44528 type:complete len:152 (+) Transcript_30042:3394-3849(+)
MALDASSKLTSISPTRLTIGYITCDGAQVNLGSIHTSRVSLATVQCSPRANCPGWNAGKSCLFVLLEVTKSKDCPEAVSLLVLLLVVAAVVAAEEILLCGAPTNSSKSAGFIRDKTELMCEDISVERDVNRRNKVMAGGRLALTTLLRRWF